MKNLRESDIRMKKLKYIAGKLWSLHQSGRLVFKCRTNGIVTYLHENGKERYEIQWDEDYMRFSRIINKEAKLCLYL